MSDLIEQSPDAQLFVQSVLSNPESYRLFPDEEFRQLTVAVIATTQLDLQGEAFHISALQDLVTRIKTGNFFVRYQHDPKIEPIGRVLDGDLFTISLSNVSFVAGIVGIYAAAAYKPFSSLGINPLSLPEESYWSFPSPDEPDHTIGVEVSAHEFPLDELKAMLESAPANIIRANCDAFRKAADPLSILCFTLSFSLLAANPFSKKFLERWGEKAADASESFAKWVGAEVVKRLSSRSRIVFRAEAGDCELEFVLETGDCSVAEKATKQLFEAGGRAAALVAALSPFDPARVVYVYDIDKESWFPKYAQTNNGGIISDAPLLVAQEQLEVEGMSVGGRKPVQDALVDQ